MVYYRLLHHDKHVRLHSDEEPGRGGRIGIIPETKSQLNARINLEEINPEIAPPKVYSDKMERLRMS